MEHQQRHPGRELALTLCVPIAALVVFFWLHELDLSFLARYCIPIGIIVTATGITLGVLFGSNLASRTNLARQRFNAPFSWLTLPGFALFGIVGIFITIENFQKYIHAARHIPLNFTALTATLLILLYYSCSFTFMTTYGYLLSREYFVRKKDAATLSPEANT